MSDILAVSTAASILTTIYDSPDAFAVYLESIQIRREMRRAKLRTHWQNALDSLLPEYDAAQREFDAELENELAKVIARFRNLLECVTTQDLLSLSILDNTPVTLTVEPNREGSLPLASLSGIPLQAVVTSITAPVEIQEIAAQSLVLEAIEEQTDNTDVQDEYRAEISGIIEVVHERWIVLDAEGLIHRDGSLNRSHCFALRALLCRLSVARALAEKSGLSREFSKSLGGLRDTMCSRRQIDKDRSDSFICKDDTWRYVETVFSENEWRNLADDFERLAVAQNVMDWFTEQEARLSDTQQQSLLNGIGAACTLVGDALLKVEGKDKLHQHLVGLLHQYKERFYLAGIAPETHAEILEQYADALPEVWQSAKDSLAHETALVDKETRRQNALNAVTILCQEPEFGSNNSRVDADRPRLLPLLDECKKASVPSSNPQLREALMECAYFLLSGQSGYLSFLNEVSKEKSRRAAEQKIAEESGDQDVDDPEFDRFIKAVRPHIEGKSLLILGGDRKTPHVEEELAKILPFASVQWLTSHKTTNVSKYEASVRKTDITCLIVNFMSHELNGKGKKWADDAGKIAVNVVKGYGPRRIVQCLYERFYGNGGGA